MLSEDYYRRDADMDAIRSRNEERDRFREVPTVPAAAKPDDDIPYDFPSTETTDPAHHG